jgi:ATP-dependent RNA helicase DeaD
MLAAFMPHVRSVAIYGGSSIGQQIDDLRRNPQIIVATPGRLIDHLGRHTIRLDKVQNRGP